MLSDIDGLSDVKQCSIISTIDFIQGLLMTQAEVLTPVQEPHCWRNKPLTAVACVQYLCANLADHKCAAATISNENRNTAVFLVYSVLDYQELRSLKLGDGSSYTLLLKSSIKKVVVCQLFRNMLSNKPISYLR